MKKEIIKVITLLIMALIIILAISELYMSAAAIDVKTLYSGTAGEGVEQTRKILGTVLIVVRIAGAGIGIIMLLVLGAKYMMASVGEKAEIKKHATTYVVGAIVMIGASGILGIIERLVTSSFE